MPPKHPSTASMTSSPPTAVICAETIALLYLLHSVPSQPSRNAFENLSFRQKGYTLSFFRERCLVGTLAFLSNLKDGPENIPAVCVAEDPDSTCLNVLLAVNKAKPGDGKTTLKSLKLGFEDISALLSQMTETRNPIMEDRVFAAIISMCSERILCRLRFVSNSRNTPRQPIKALLLEALGAVDRLEGETTDTNLLQTASFFNQKAKAVLRMVNAWTKYRTLARLGEVVQGMHVLWHVSGLSTLIDAIPNQLMGPSSRANLLNIIGKVARYREAARFLYRTARKIPLVRQMKVVLARLPETAFQKTQLGTYTPSISSGLSRIHTNTKTSQTQQQGQASTAQICQLLSLSQENADENIAQQTQKTLREGKIHAEMQLLFSNEFREAKRQPRVICSSKDACFLCNAFLSLLSGKVHTPRCHGRLYPGWKLPYMSPGKEGFNMDKSGKMGIEIQQRFNTALATHLSSSVATLLARRKKTVYLDPNESTLLTLPASVSTILLEGTDGVSEVLGESIEESVQQPRGVINQGQLQKVPSASASTVSRSEVPLPLKLSESVSAHRPSPAGGISSQTQSVLPIATSASPVSPTLPNTLSHNASIHPQSQSNSPSETVPASQRSSISSSSTSSSSISPPKSPYPTTSALTGICSLQQGHQHQISQRIKPNYISPLYTVGPDFEFQIEFCDCNDGCPGEIDENEDENGNKDAGSRETKQSPTDPSFQNNRDRNESAQACHPNKRRLDYTIEWLTTAEATAGKAREAQSAVIFNTEQLEEGEEVCLTSRSRGVANEGQTEGDNERKGSKTVEDQNCYYITARGCTLRVLLR